MEKYLCPYCNKRQSDNGMLAWCETGHVISLPKTDPRALALKAELDEIRKADKSRKANK
jgi:hypothetical protein